ncbi:14015_t:CDS:2 [Dentiscutata erythropus]|uniref:14015_t:CDS:1 n=1 Tax=Dentiscutata erythropus TaxID=1348616 RepID=A0A9N9CX66_9GLOM|nr:14015_t:CDS:2 [Dentiscutata erythropus]
MVLSKPNQLKQSCGTLSSYTWTCMVLNFLQMCYPPILPVLKVDRKNEDEDIDLLKVGYKNNESIATAANCIIQAACMAIKQNNIISALSELIPDFAKCLACNA